jgi:hypothetical protein
MNPNDFDQLEKDFVQENVHSNNPFGQSITREILQQSKKDVQNDFGNENSSATGPIKKNLEIEIDENDDYNAQNE